MFAEGQWRPSSSSRQHSRRRNSRVANQTTRTRTWRTASRTTDTWRVALQRTPRMPGGLTLSRPGGMGKPGGERRRRRQQGVGRSHSGGGPLEEDTDGDLERGFLERDAGPRRGRRGPGAGGPGGAGPDRPDRSRGPLAHWPSAGPSRTRGAPSVAGGDTDPATTEAPTHTAAPREAASRGPQAFRRRLYVLFHRLGGTTSKGPEPTGP